MQVSLNPAGHTVYLDRAERENAVGREQYQNVIAFIAKTESITDQEQLLEVLERELPEFHATLVKFQKWLGVCGYPERSGFEDLISKIVEAILLGGEKVDSGQLSGALEKGLEWVVFATSGEFEGVFIDRYSTGRRISLYNPHLKAVLPLLAIKAAQAKAGEKSEDKYLGDYYKKQVQRCRELTQGLAQSYEEEIKKVDKALRGIMEMREAVVVFKEETGMTDEEIARLIKAVTDKDGRDGRPRFNGHLYTALFNAFALHKQGVVDMRSPAFKGLFESLFPGVSETFWKSL